jgi:flavin-dependent thymidylate synthase
MSQEIQKYADAAMFDAEPMRGRDGPEVFLISATPNPLGAIAAACRMYEGKVTRNLSEINYEEMLHYWEQVQKTHLKAPLEFVDLHFLVEGVTRAFTHQMVRQRTAVYAQESMRFAVKDEIAARPGPSIAGDRKARELWEHHMEKTWETYNAMIANGVPAEDARGVLPHDTLTRLHYKTNLRNLLEHAGNRLCTQAQFEWRSVFIEIVKAIEDHVSVSIDLTAPVAGDNEGFGAPSVSNAWQWQHIAESQVFKPVCFSLGHCPFNADFDRGCTIRPRVEEGKFDEIDPREYMSDPKAAWVNPAYLTHTE